MSYDKTSMKARLIGLAGFAIALAAALVAGWFIAVQAAYADNVQLDAPVTVSDDVTRVHVNKLDADTHEYVKGATMSIIEEETGTVVDSWVTGPSTHVNEKALNVGVVYILREVSAPEGYEKVSDVRFEIKQTEGEGISILSSDGEEVELTESYKLAVYDKALPSENVQKVTKERPGGGPPETTSSSSSSSSSKSSSSSTTTSSSSKTPENTSKVVAPKTGDETPLTLVAALMGVGVSIILILQLVKRRMPEE